jgi:hypothetical protein
MNKPEFLTEDMLLYLDDLRESGVTNMFRARPYLMRAFKKLTEQQAGEVMSYWMHMFGERHKP